MTLSRAFTGYELSMLGEKSPLTVAAYLSSLRLLESFLSDPPVADITEKDIGRFFGYLNTEYKPSRSTNDGHLSTASIHRYWKVIRSFFKWADKEFGTRRLDASFKTPRYENSEINPYSEEEVKALLKACVLSTVVKKANKHEYQFQLHMSSWDIAIQLVLLDTGLRPSELCRLRIVDLNIYNGEMQVKPHQVGKTKPRTVIIEKSARKTV